MRFRNTIIVFVLAAVLGGYALINVIGLKPVAPDKLVKVDVKDISTIELRYPAGSVEIERNPDRTWEIVKPFRADADQTAADGLASNIADATISKTVEPNPADLAPFGLKNPAVVVTVTSSKAGVLPAIEVGRLSPMGSGAYVKVVGKPALLMTSSAFPSEVTRKPDDLRSHDLFTFNLDDANKVIVNVGANPPTELDRIAGKWQIVAPAKYPADPDKVNSLLTALINARAVEFVNDAPTDLSKYGLATPQAQVSVFTGKGNAEQSLLFGFKEPQAELNAVYVKRGEGPTVFTAQSDLLTKINLPIPDLRDKTLLSFDPHQVGRLEFVNRGKRYALVRGAAGKWDVVENGKSSPANNDAVRSVLDEIQALKGESIVVDPMTNPQPFGIDKPLEEITLVGIDGKTIGTIKLNQISATVPNEPTPTPAPGAPTQMRTVMGYTNYAFSSATPALMTLKESDFSQFDMAADDFRLSTPVPSPSATVTPTP